MLDFILSLDGRTVLVCTGFFSLCGLLTWAYDKLGEREPGEAEHWEIEG